MSKSIVFRNFHKYNFTMVSILQEVLEAIPPLPNIGVEAPFQG